MDSKREKLILVSGNQSGDLDTLISSYVKAEILKHNIHQSKKVIVLFNFSAQELKLHGETIYLFNKNNIDLSNIIYLDEFHTLNLDELYNDDLLEIVLTDHNFPMNSLQPYVSCISEIIDHHRILKPINSNIKQSIENTGSCSTLVAEQFIASLNSKNYNYNKLEIAQIANLLFYTIQIDIEHLTLNKEYNLHKDYSMLAILSNYIKSKDSILNDIKKEKMNFQNYTIEDYLLKDYKFWITNQISYGISSIYIDIEHFLNLESDFNDLIKNFMTIKNIQILFLMHFSKEPILKREITVIFLDSCRFKSELLNTISNSDLFEENKIYNKDGSIFSHFRQLNVDFSRKKIQPYLETIIKDLKENLC